ncbi:uncharacterized protein METZ01_LOCUS490594, partial [marine metagenome]
AAQSIPEVILNMQDRGAIGFISATRVGFHDSNMILARQFLSRMFRNATRDIPVGLALMEAKQRILVGDDLRTNIQRYSLFGDPALYLARPPYRVELELPDTLEALQVVEVEGRIIGPDGTPDNAYNGTGRVQVFNSAAMSQLQDLPYIQLGSPIFRGLSEVVDGRIRARFLVPKDITYRANKGRVSVYVWGEEKGTGFGAKAGLVLEGTAEGVEIDVYGPDITFAFAGQPEFRDGDFV